MTSGWNEICCVSLPRESLTALAAIRDVPNVLVALANGRAIVRWDQGDDRVLRAAIPIAGADLYVHRDEKWYRFGHHLPVFDLPDQAAFRPLCQVVTPLPMRSVPAPPQPLQPVGLSLVPDMHPRPATAVRCSAAALAQWADKVPTASLETIRAARYDKTVLLIGQQLPLTGQRFWGDGMLVPLGWRPDPNLPANAIREALGISKYELLLLNDKGDETIPFEAFGGLTRAQIRLANTKNFV